MTYEPRPVTAAIAQQHLMHVRTTLPQLDQLIRAAIQGAQTLAEGEGATLAVREEIAARFAPALDLLDGLIAQVGAAREHQAPSISRVTFLSAEQIERRYLDRSTPRELRHLASVAGCGRRTDQEYAAAHDLPDDGPEAPPPRAA